MAVARLVDQLQIAFSRQELDQLMQLYGRMVAAGHWRDYAIAFEKKSATFSAFRRAADRPEYRLVKDPALRNRQGQYILYGEADQILRRGHELGPVLSPIARRLIKRVK